MTRDGPGSGWFAFGVRLFGAALPIGLLVVLFAPVQFMEWLGAFALVGSIVGLAVSLAGLRLVSSSRWQAGSMKQAVPAASRHAR